MEQEKILTEEEKRIARRAQRRQSVRQFFRVFLGRGILAKICFVIFILFVIMAIFAPILTPYDPYEQSPAQALTAPTAQHPLGFDHLGRDLLTRTIYGARIAMCTGLLSSFWGLVIGVTLGLIAGYFEGFVGNAIMRLMDAQLSIPPIILTMCLAAIFGGSIMSVSFIIGISSVPSFVRMVYGQVLSLRENDYITAGKLIGLNEAKIMFRHLLPNCFATIIVMFSSNVGAAVMIEAGLAYLGVGITAPTPAWGTMISEGYNYLMFKPILAIAPGIALMLLIISLNIVGDGLRDALDPRLRGKL